MDYLYITYLKEKILVLYRVILVYCQQLLERKLCSRRAFVVLLPSEEAYSPVFYPLSEIRSIRNFLSYSHGTITRLSVCMVGSKSCHYFLDFPFKSPGSANSVVSRVASKIIQLSSKFPSFHFPVLLNNFLRAKVAIQQLIIRAIKIYGMPQRLSG